MSNFQSTTFLQVKLHELQADYRQVNVNLNQAKKMGFRGDVRALTRTKNRISDKINQVRSELEKNSSQYSATR